MKRGTRTHDSIFDSVVPIYVVALTGLNQLSKCRKHVSYRRYYELYCYLFFYLYLLLLLL